MPRLVTAVMLVGVLGACKSTPPVQTGTDAGPPDAGTRTDAGPPDAGFCATPTTGAVGSGCQQDSDCTAPGAICLTDMPGGFCLVPDCQRSSCPSGSVCTPFSDGSFNCVPQCFGRDACCGREGYFCDIDQTCWSDAYSFVNAGGRAIGAACEGDADCEGGHCIPNTLGGRQTSNPGGYCTHDCAPNHPASCPSGSQCRDYLCRDNCATNADCRPSYSCQNGACVTDPTLVTLGGACAPATEATDCGPGECVVGTDSIGSFPGGFCTLIDTCEPGPDQGCGANGHCVRFASAVGPTAFCAPKCTTDNDCRVAKGYVCDPRVGACLRGTADPSKVPLGRTCQTNSDCNSGDETHGICLEIIWDQTIFPDGYCVAPGCTPFNPTAGTVDSCGQGGKCEDLGPSPFLYCVKKCQQSAECRQGYTCQGGECLP